MAIKKCRKCGNKFNAISNFQWYCNKCTRQALEDYEIKRKKRQRKYYAESKKNGKILKRLPQSLTKCEFCGKRRNLLDGRKLGLMPKFICKGCLKLFEENKMMFKLR